MFVLITPSLVLSCFSVLSSHFPISLSLYYQTLKWFLRNSYMQVYRVWFSLVLLFYKKDLAPSLVHPSAQIVMCWYCKSTYTCKSLSYHVFCWYLRNWKSIIQPYGLDSAQFYYAHLKMSIQTFWVIFQSLIKLAVQAGLESTHSCPWVCLLEFFCQKLVQKKTVFITVQSFNGRFTKTSCPDKFFNRGVLTVVVHFSSMFEKKKHKKNNLHWYKNVCDCTFSFKVLVCWDQFLVLSCQIGTEMTVDTNLNLGGLSCFGPHE